MRCSWLLRKKLVGRLRFLMSYCLARWGNNQFGIDIDFYFEATRSSFRDNLHYEETWRSSP